MKYLVVVDMQRDFVNGTLGSEMAERICPAVAEKIVEYNAPNCCVIVTMDTHEKNYLSTAEGKKLPVPHCIRYTDGWELDDRISAVLTGTEKVYFKNTFGSTALAHDLQTRIKPDDTITLVGLCTDICVVSNAILLKAFMPEISISVISSCCAGVTEQSHLAALDTMKMCQIDVVGD